MTENNENQRNYRLEFDQFAGHDTYGNIAKKIDEITDKDTAFEYRRMLLDDFLDNLVGNSDFYESDHILGDDPIGFLRENANKDKPSDHEFIKAFLAFHDHDYTLCLALLDEVFSYERMKDIIFNEEDFYYDFLKVFKNAFPGFWEHIRSILEKLPKEDGLLELCDTVKFYYYSTSPTDVMNNLSSYLEHYPKSRIAADLLIMQAWRKGDSDTVIARMNESSSHFAFDDGIKYGMLGTIFSKKNDHLKAAAYYEKCLEYTPDAVDIKNDLGLEYLDGKQYEKALKVFNECMEENRDLPYTPNNYVRTLLKMKKYQEALEFIQTTQFKIDKSLINRVNKRIQNTAESNETDVKTEDNELPDQQNAEPLCNEEPSVPADEPAETDKQEPEAVDAETEDDNTDRAGTPVFWKGGDDPFLQQLNDPDEEYIQQIEENEKYAQEIAVKLMYALKQCDIEAELLSYYSSAAITRYEIRLGKTVRIREIKKVAPVLQATLNVRFLNIEAPIPGKNAIGIDIPSLHAVKVPFKKVMFRNRHLSQSPLTVCVGEDMLGNELFFDLRKLENILVAGSLDEEKGTFLHAIAMSLLINSKPEDVRLVLIDPRQIEFAPYSKAPHLLIPVISNAEMAREVLSYLALICDTRRNVFANKHVKNLDAYNRNCQGAEEKLPQIVVMINCFQEILGNDPESVWKSLEYIIQLSPVVGVNIILSVTRVSADVLTSNISNDINTKVYFALPPGTDSRTLSDDSSIKNLNGDGEMIIKVSNSQYDYYGIVTAVMDNEMNNIVQYTGSLYTARFDDHFMTFILNHRQDDPSGFDEIDPLYKAIKEFAVEQQKVSTSLLQRRFGIGYNRAVRFIDYLLDEGIISKPSSPTAAYVVNHGSENVSISEEHESNDPEVIITDINDIPKFSDADILVKLSVLPSKKTDLRYYLNGNRIAPDIIGKVIEYNQKRFFPRKINIRYELGPGADDLLKTNREYINIFRNNKVLWYVNPEEKSLADNDWLIILKDQLKHTTCQVEDGFKYVDHCNESVLTLHLPQQTFILCPERMYMVTDSKIKGISYGSTKINVGLREAICYSGKAPSGFQICRYTYEHTTSDGSPDLRYKNNPRYPIVEFVKIEMVIDDVSYFFIASNAEYVKSLYRAQTLEDLRLLQDRLNNR